jgi:tetratricopeptide (TPR) repeat protein
MTIKVEYHTANIRKLLLEAYREEELRRLCYDEPDLRPVRSDFARVDPLAVIVDKLVEYADDNCLLGTLLDLVEEQKPDRYEFHRPYSLVERIPSQATVEVIVYEEAGNVENPEKLFGRNDLSARVHAHLDASEKVLLYGLGGTGKTALAATIADQRITQGQGPVIWVKVGKEEAGVIFDALTMGFATDKEKPELSRLTGDAEIIAVRRLLARTEAGLIVLDNAWSGPALRRVLKAIPGGMRVLVTSRLKFILDVQLEVGDLLPHDALELLAHEAGEETCRDGAEARLLCKELGYHAYALEIAGAILKVDDTGPVELRKRIAGAPHDLPIPFDMAEEGRESVKALLDTSFEALDEDGKGLFRTFGALFTPGATPALLAACQQKEERAVREALRKLVRRSMVRRQTEAYYTLHDLTFSYARALCEDRGQDHRETVVAVERYVTDHARDFDNLALDQNNILAAARAARTEDVEALISIVSVLATADYLDTRGHTLELVHLLDETIEAVEKKGAEEYDLLHSLVTKRGNVHFDRGELQEACDTYQLALDLAPNDNRRVLLLVMRGKVCSEQGRYEEAEAHFQEGLELAQATGDKPALAFLLRNQSFAAGRRGEYEQARQYAARALEVTRQLEVPNPIGLGYSLLLLGSAEYEAGVHKALSLHRQVHEIARAEGALDLMALALYALGSDHHALDEYEEARKHLAEARQLFRDSGNTAEEAEVTIFMKEYGYLAR